MRKATGPRQRPGCPPVADVQLNHDCRDEIIPVLAALCHVYGQPAPRDHPWRAQKRSTATGS